MFFRKISLYGKSTCRTEFLNTVFFQAVFFAASEIPCSRTLRARTPFLDVVNDFLVDAFRLDVSNHSNRSVLRAETSALKFSRNRQFSTSIFPGPLSKMFGKGPITLVWKRVVVINVGRMPIPCEKIELREYRQRKAKEAYPGIP